MIDDVQHTKLIVAFVRIPATSSETSCIYLKQDEVSGEYAVKYMNKKNEKVLYSTTQFLPTALATMALLMAEFGIGCNWRTL